MIANVTDHGALGDGFSDDAPAISAAIQSAGYDGAVQLEAGRTYKLAASLTLDEKVSLLGAGAILLSDTLDAPAMKISSHGATLDRLRFIGPQLDTGIAPLTFARSCGVEIVGSGAIVSGCRFEGYTYGGVKVIGNGCHVQGNHFGGVRHYSERGIADWLGVIHIAGNDNTIAGNILEEVWDTGIQIKGGHRNQVSHNRITCSLHANATQSMGMRINHGGQNNTFANNLVRYARQESISLAAPAGLEVCGNIVTGNTLLDGGWAGIALAARGGLVNRNVISHNSIRAVERVWDLGIILNTRKGVGVMYNLIEGNMLYGELVDGLSQLQRGIHLFGPGTHGNQMIGNRVTNVRYSGIDCAGSDTLVTGNYVEGCEVGINAAYCPGSFVTGNMVRRSKAASIRLLQDVAGMVVSGNTTDGEVMLATGKDAPRGTYVVAENYGAKEKAAS